MKAGLRRAIRSFYQAPGLSFIPWIVMSPLAVLGTGSFVPETGEVSTDLEWLVVGLFAHLVFVPFIFIGNWIAKSFNFKYGSILIVTLLVMGAARGFTVSYSAEYFNLVEQADFAWRIFAGMLLTVGWYSVTNAVVFEIKDYLKALSELRGELHREHKYLEQSEIDLQNSRQEVRDQTLKLVDLGLVQVETEGKDTSQLQKIANELNRLVDQGLAPLIKKLQDQPTKPNFIIAPYQKVSGFQIAKTAFTEKPFFILPAIFIQMIGAFASKVWALGFFGALVDLAIVSFAIFVSYSLGQMVINRLDSNPLKVATSFLFLMLPALVSAFTPYLVVPGSELVAGSSFSLFNNVFAAGFLSAIGFAAKQEAEKVIDQLEVAIEQTALARSRAEQLRLVEKKRLARILHGSVQSKIRSLALEIERTGVAPEKQKLEDFRSSIIEEISNPSQANLVDFLFELKELWGASAEISYDLDDEIPDLLFNDRNAQVAVIEIIREVVSNAMKHSKSETLKFKIGRYQGVSESLGIITISAVFDGVKIGKTHAGNGLRTIGELSSHFSYHSDSKANYFSAEVPVTAQLSVATTGT